MRGSFSDVESIGDADGDGVIDIVGYDVGVEDDDTVGLALRTSEQTYQGIQADGWI